MSKCVTYQLISTAASHYTDAIAANGGVEIESFPGLRSDGWGCIEAITIQSLENLAWQVELQDYSENVLRKHSFTENDGQQLDVNGTMVWVYNASLNPEWGVPSIPAYDTTPVGLRNMSSSAKTTGASGAVTVIITVRK